MKKKTDKNPWVSINVRFKKSDLEAIDRAVEKGNAHMQKSLPMGTQTVSRQGFIRSIVLYDIANKKY